MSRRRPRGSGGGTSSRRKRRLSESSDETESDGSSSRQRKQHRRRSTRGGRRYRSYSSPSTDSNDSGITIETQGDGEHTRRGHRYRSANVGARLGSSSQLLCTSSGKIRMIKSLRRKLLSNNGFRLSRIERRLLQADRARSGVVSISTFKAALSKETKSENGVEIERDEIVWLVENLRGRNGKNVAILKMRELLEMKETDVERRSGAKFPGKMERHGDYRTRRGSTQSSSRSRGIRRADESSTDDEARDSSGSERKTTSESDTSRRGPTTLQRRSSPAAPARWAIRHGTVGQWLQDVAAPMERKLFFEFIKGLEKFELRNGLDHYRVRPRARPTRRQNFGGDNGGATRHCGEDDGTTVLHLGPMLKASIRFYV